MRTVPDNYKLNPGAVEALLERPGEGQISRMVNCGWNSVEKGFKGIFISHSPAPTHGLG